MSNARSDSQNETLLPRTLLNLGWRYLLGHPWQSALMVIGITLGVAVVIAIDLANASAGRAFDLGTETVFGRATHQIVAGPQGLDESLYVDLRRQGIAPAAAPVVSAYVSSSQLGNLPLQLLGVDPFAETPFRSYLAQEQGPPITDLATFLTQPGAILISNELAQRYGLSPGDSLTLDVLGSERSGFVAGLLYPADGLSRRALAGILLADIATAQELTDRIGRLDRIDLILPDDGATAERIRALLPQSARILPADARSNAVKEMTSAFHHNLTALSLLALVVGLFLIYNTMTFSIIQRRALFGTLRCLGVTRREIFILVTVEALAVGTIGAGLGLLLGIVMGQGALRLVSQTINDLYFVVTVRGVEIPGSSLLKGAFLGVVATVLTAVPPAWEAASVPPRAALSRSGLEGKARRASLRVAVGGFFLLIAGTGALALPTHSLAISFGALTTVVLGFAMLTPVVSDLFMRVLIPALGRLWGTLGRLAPRDVTRSLSRTAVAVAALMVAMSVTIGISLMIGSFRRSVVVWLSHAVQADIHIIASNITAREGLVPINGAVMQAVQRWPGLARIDWIRGITVDSPYGPVYVESNDSPNYGAKLLYLSVDGSPEAAWEAVRGGAVLVSEPLANRVALPRTGGSLTLYTDKGPQAFPVAGIHYEYASSQGSVIMFLDTYRQYWNDDTITAIALFLEPGTDPDDTVAALQNTLLPLQRLSIRPNQSLREEALAIFDRTFAITSALQLLATTVAFVGVLSALLSLQLERAREFGVLRAVGLTARQLWGLVLGETGLMGAAAGLLAMPTGIVLSLILVYIINRRAFGWTLQLQLALTPFVQAFLSAVLAALLAGIWPAHRMSRAIPAEALRTE